MKPSFSLGVVAPKPLTLSTFSKKKRTNTSHKKHLALHDLNKKIATMWKGWN
jgi:hypothetical protein